MYILCHLEKGRRTQGNLCTCQFDREFDLINKSQIYKLFPRYQRTCKKGSLSNCHPYPKFDLIGKMMRYNYVSLSLVTCNHHKFCKFHQFVGFTLNPGTDQKYILCLFHLDGYILHNRNIFPPLSRFDYLNGTHQRHNIFCLAQVMYKARILCIFHSFKESPSLDRFPECIG